MPEIHYLSEEHILIFLLQVGVLLGMARGFGELLRRRGQPAITAEILVGIVLGPTVLGRVWPQLHQALFPPDVMQQNMLDTVAWLGILLFLLNAGLETNLSAAWRLKKLAATISMSDLIIPMIVAFLPSLLLPASYVGAGGSKLVFALFIATIMTISALPVTARVLQDLKVYRTDLGLLIMSALTINDVAGWLVFALILGFFTEAAVTVWSILFIIVATVAFASAWLGLGPRVMNRALTWLNKSGVPEPGGSLTVISVAGILSGAITLWIGIHALFGFFIAGILAGETRALSERTRQVFSQMVHALLVPLFFASIGLKLDFLAQFDLLIVLFILFIGVAGRYAGAWIGARLAGQRSHTARFTAVAHIPGGEMQIVIGILALEYGVINQPVYVAIIIGAIASSMLAGPWMAREVQRVRRVDWLAYLPLDHVLMALQATDRDNAIRELCTIAARAEDMPAADELARAVIEREGMMSTALDEGVAAPHARIPGLGRPQIVVSRSLQGLDWNARDGKPVHLIFLLITPAEQADIQLQVLRGVSSSLRKPEVRQAVLGSRTSAEVIALLRSGSS